MLDTTEQLDQVMNIKTLIHRAASLWGDRVALTFDEFNQSLTFTDIELQTNKIANMFLRMGLQSGESVAVMLKNRSEFALIWLALAKIGATMVPINVYYKEYDAKYLLEHSEAKFLITSHEFIQLIQNIRPFIPTLKKVFSVDSAEGLDIYDFHHLLLQMPDDLPDVKLFPETRLNIQYTSGTTGKPKGCILTHGYWLSIARRFVEDPPHINENDVMLTAQPFYYMDPQWNLIVTLASGSRLIVLDRFHPSTFWEKVRDYKVTFFYCLGLMPTLLLKNPPSSSDSINHVRCIMCSAIPPHLHKELEERWKTPWYELFGMTETGIDITITPDEHDHFVGSGCIGRPKKHREARIVDEHDRPVPRGTVGELVLRGPWMMDGYYKDPEATESAFRGGWFHTGDLAWMDEQGYIYYVGRKKDMIRRSGENISASEVEEVIKLHPSVQYVACVPVPDEIRGEEVKAYVVLRSGETQETVPPEELIEFCSNKIAYFKVPRYWEYRKRLPRTPSERVAKHLLLKEKSDLRVDSYDSVDKIWR